MTRPLLFIALGACVPQPPFHGLGSDGGSDSNGSGDCSMAFADDGTVTFDDGCPSPKGTYEKHCYEVHSDWLLWQASVDDCASGGGYLASVSSGGENSFLVALESGGDIFIGAQQMSGQTAWADGEPVTYKNWIGSGDGCAQLAPAGWSPIDCGGGYRGRICETAGWTRFHGHDYRHYYTSFDWQTASNDCVIHGGRLASVTDSCTLQFLFALAPVHETFWLGAKRPEGGSFSWTHGETWSYEAFGAGEPSSAAGANCLSFDAFSSSWTAADCTKTQGYICERDVP